jgi:hypothetical protein
MTLTNQSAQVHFPIGFIIVAVAMIIAEQYLTRIYRALA